MKKLILLLIFIFFFPLHGFGQHAGGMGAGSSSETMIGASGLKGKIDFGEFETGVGIAGSGNSTFNPYGHVKGGGSTGTGEGIGLNSGNGSTKIYSSGHGSNGSSGILTGCQMTCGDPIKWKEEACIRQCELNQCRKNCEESKNKTTCLAGCNGGGS